MEPLLSEIGNPFGWDEGEARAAENRLGWRCGIVVGHSSAFYLKYWCLHGCGVVYSSNVIVLSLN
jgi:hypothetical protein